jgi:hypothetical protein
LVRHVFTGYGRLWTDRFNLDEPTYIARYSGAKIPRVKKLTEEFFFAQSTLKNTRIGQNTIGGD